MTDKHLVIVRSCGSIINLGTYNCQELGLSKALTKRGLKVSLVLAGSENRTLRVSDGECEIKVYFVKYKCLGQSLAWFENIETLLDSLNPTHVQVHDLGMLMSWRVVRWAKRHDVDCYLIQGNYQTTRKKFFRQLEELFNYTFGKYILQNVSGIGCKTLMAARYVNKYTDRSTTQTPIGLDTSAFDNAIEKNWQEELNIEEKKVLLYVGTLEPRRNPDFLIDVVEGLSDEYVLLMVGNGPMYDALFDMVVKKKLENKCIMLGKQKQDVLPSLYKISDLFLLASDYEIYGMVVLEAMYFGVPVISTLTAGSEVMISSGKDGMVIPKKNAKEWRTAINDICSDGVKSRTMKNHAKTKIRQSLIWEEACKTFLHLYGFDCV